MARNAFAPVDVAAARQRGIDNALSQMQARSTMNELTRQRAVRGAFQQGGGTEQVANRLREQGYGPTANQLLQQQQQRRAGQLETEVTGLKYIAARAPMVRDQQSYDAFRQDLEQQGLADPGELPEQYSPELINRLSGKAQERLSASDLVEVQGPQGGSYYMPAQQAAGMRAPGGDDNTQTEREVQRYIERGYPRSVAEDIAYGNIDVETDQFGNTYLVNKATGERRVLRGEGNTGGQRGEQVAQQSTEAPSGEAGADLGQAVEEGTGPFSMGRAAINAVIGPFVEGTVFPETSRSRAAIRNFNQTAKQALVNSERFPVYEQKIVQQLLPDPDQFFNDPDAEREKLTELRGFLQRKKGRIQESMQAGGITTEERGNLSNQVSTIDRILGLMEPMQQRGHGAQETTDGQQYSRTSPAQPQTQSDYDALPSGAYFVDDEGLKRKP